MLFGGCDLRVRVCAEEDFAEALAREEARLRAVQFYFLEFLAPLAFKFAFGKRCFTQGSSAAPMK